MADKILVKKVNLPSSEKVAKKISKKIKANTKEVYANK